MVSKKIIQFVKFAIDKSDTKERDQVEVIEEDEEISITDSWIKYMEDQIEESEEIKTRMLFIQKWFKDWFRIRTRNHIWKKTNKRLVNKFLYFNEMEKG